ncbi:hypothetical protein ACPOL_1946 [Acidisarcina polymorpha]|uniref:Uncharacterized protein n=1 Tax=Acidisarcina polymorpha TaxID=2211140 RepID=A0A2Z5FWY8_9BACT|nr:hypothetical protein ACPOL_1946 [Acidisarcina polymorpha]
MGLLAPAPAIARLYRLPQTSSDLLRNNKAGGLRQIVLSLMERNRLKLEKDDAGRSEESGRSP